MNVSNLSSSLRSSIAKCLSAQTVIKNKLHLINVVTVEHLFVVGKKKIFPILILCTCSDLNYFLSDEVIDSPLH